MPYSVYTASALPIHTRMDKLWHPLHTSSTPPPLPLPTSSTPHLLHTSSTQLPLHRTQATRLDASFTLAPHSQVKAYFKNVAGVDKSGGWSSFIKQAPVTPPAQVIPVGGSSNLQMELRQDFYTIQNLTR